MKPRRPIPRVSPKRLARDPNARYGTIARGQRPTRKAKPKAKNANRAKREWVRAYHSEERVSWIWSLPCLECGARGCDNVHVVGGGAGRKASYRAIVPLCRRAHLELHRIGLRSFEAKHDLNLAERAVLVEARWQDLQRGVA